MKTKEKYKEVEIKVRLEHDYFITEKVLIEIEKDLDVFIQNISAKYDLYTCVDILTEEKKNV